MTYRVSDKRAEDLRVLAEGRTATYWGRKPILDLLADRADMKARIAEQDKTIEAFMHLGDRQDAQIGEQRAILADVGMVLDIYEEDQEIFEFNRKPLLARIRALNGEKEG